jgi:VanZ family protein
MKSKPARTDVVFKYLFWTWLILIITISSIPDLPGLELATGDTLFRLDYLIHGIEYCVLVTFFLFWKGGKWYRISNKFVLFTLIGSLLIASLDEYHQLWIPGRTFNPMDMYANFTGLLTGILFSLIMMSKLRSGEGKNG